MAVNMPAPPSDWRCSSFACQVRCTLGIPHVHLRISSEHLTCSQCEQCEHRKKKRLQKYLNVYLCVCVGLVVFLKSITSLAFFLSLWLFSCVAQAVCGCPFPYEEPNSDKTVIVTKDLVHHLQIWTNFFHCFSVENNPNSLYNALTREFSLLYTI